MSKTRDVAGILHFLTTQQMAEEIVRLDAVIAAAPPEWKGYALLGTGLYCIEHTAAPPDPHLGAELIIRPAKVEDMVGNRQIGEERGTDGRAIQPEEMAIRIGFLSAAALDALEAQLRHLRRENFPAAVSTPYQFWLIERGPNQGWPQTSWWNDSPDGRICGWKTSVHEATQFATKELAETAAQSDRGLRLADYAITSHGFMSPLGAPTDSTEATK